MHCYKWIYPTLVTCLFYRMQGEQLAMYDVVPTMRPVVLMGPSLKGLEVSEPHSRQPIYFVKLNDLHLDSGIYLNPASLCFSR